MTDDPFIRRTRAAQATLDQWSARPMRLGTSDCVRMTAAHLRRLGHKVKLPASGAYRTTRSALKALEERGYTSLADALDAMELERIAPAEAIVGDVLMLPAEDKLGALVVALGNGRVVGYHSDAVGAAVLQPVEYIAAWRAF
ncbi:hypothetical protein [Sphingomonas sp. GM_Shp_1]|uniref:DUF6950 family protein n=1 Tax=Sphingomonas sp. GM_Shp_1 TaxID=2937381 RepID=UPI00226B7CAA|nr:hypothetical protein [Sphingomonas sp. GM_Shp_1]